MTREEALSYATDTEAFVSGALETNAPALFRSLFPGRRALIVADENTWRAAGARLADILRSAGVEVDEPYVFSGAGVLEPDYAYVADLRARIDADLCGLVAVGSGTLNDIVKVAAYEEKIRYMIVATAASVDGYTSPGASMVVDGFKESLYCRAPATVLADGRVLASAPPQMLRSGYADLSSKITAGADWIIAEEVGVDPIDPVCWRMIQLDLLDWLSGPKHVARGEVDSLDRVMYGLTLTGIGMQYLRRSRPASGAEHLMSHVWEMNHHRHEGRPVSHGFKVAVATLACTALMEIVLRRPPSKREREERLADWPRWEEREREIRGLFGAAGGVERIISECRKKYVTVDALERRLAELEWDRLRGRVEERLLPFAELRRRFAEAGCPSRPEEIGIDAATLAATFPAAGMLRSRYTILDLAYESGRLESAATEIVSSSDYFG